MFSVCVHTEKDSSCFAHDRVSKQLDYACGDVPERAGLVAVLADIHLEGIHEHATRMYRAVSFKTIQ